MVFGLFLAGVGFLVGFWMMCFLGCVFFFWVCGVFLELCLDWFFVLGVSY